MPVRPTQHPPAHNPPAQHCVPSSAQRWLHSWTRSGAGRGCDLRAQLCANPRGSGCGQCSVSPHGLPSAGWQPGRAGAALRSAQLCRQRPFASRRARHLCQPPGCQPTASQSCPVWAQGVGAGSALLPPGLQTQQKHFSQGVSAPFGSETEVAMGWPLLVLGVPCCAIPLHHPWHGLWGPEVAPCDVGIPTSDPPVTAATCPLLHLSTAPTCPRYPTGLSPLHPGTPRVPSAPAGTCPGGRARRRSGSD